MNDITALFQYLLTIEFLGLALFPLSYVIFKRLPDRGWGFAKIIGVLVVAYIVWLFSSIHLVPFSLQNTITISIITALIVWIILFKRIDSSLLKSAWKIILFEEFLFIGVSAIWTFVRGFSPDINGLEKFMDYGFMLSILKTEYFPPLDHFLARETINYYYYGHYLAAFITKLAQVPASLGYNLQMSIIFGFTAIQSFSLGSGIFYLLNKTELSKRPWRSYLAGILSFLLVGVFGNLHTVFYYPLNPSKYWYPDATRFIYNTIHEFPIYSFIVNDLHGHVSDIPIVILTLALILILVLSFNKPVKPIISKQEIINILPKLLLLSFFIGTMYATNAWDFAIYLVVSGAIFWTMFSSSSTLTGWKQRLFDRSVLINTTIISVILLFSAILFFAPFWLHLTPISKGIGIVPLNGHSYLYQIAILWGVQVPLTLFLILWIRNIYKTRKFNIKEKIIQILSSLLAVTIQVNNPTTQLTDPEINDPIELGSRKVEKIHVYMIILAIVSFTLIILPEIIFIRDIYPAHYRANTMFKFYYQAWIMLGIIAGVGTVYLWQYFNRTKNLYGKLFKIISVFLLFSALIYPMEAIMQAFGEFKSIRKSIDGTMYLKDRLPADAEAIDWINKNITGQPTFLEAVGDSYTDYARVAANTGNPSVLGWPVHEWLWRGDYSLPMKPITQVQKQTGQTDSVGVRVEDAKKIYESTDINETKNLMNKYQIEYVYIGKMEREKYSNINEDKFSSFGSIVYQKNNVLIFKMSQ